MFWIKENSALVKETHNIKDQIECDLKGWGINDEVIVYWLSYQFMDLEEMQLK